MRYFNLHTHSSVNDSEILEVVNQYPREFNPHVSLYSIGIHPWHIDELLVSGDLEIIESKLLLDDCLALGECGLDKRIETPLNLQLDVFEKQLAIAEKYKKPVILHCVAAFSEVIEVKKRLGISVPMIIHGFSKNEQTAKQLLDNGFYLSFGKYLLRNPELESVFKMIPEDRFFLETDTIEEGIRDVYALAAQYRNIESENLKNIISRNFNHVFNSALI